MVKQNICREGKVNCKYCEEELLEEDGYEDGDEFCQACLDDVPKYRLWEYENN